MNWKTKETQRICLSKKYHYHMSLKDTHFLNIKYQLLKISNDNLHWKLNEKLMLNSKILSIFMHLDN